jgi:6-phosphogluconolactonase
VAPIDDSPKPPASRITLTFPVLNKLCRRIIFCGAGASKQPILAAVFKDAKAKEIVGEEQPVGGAKAFAAEMVSPPPYPCGIARTEQGGDSLIWVVDADAAEDAHATKSSI